MRILTAAKFAAATTSVLLLATGTAHALTADKPTTAATATAASAATHTGDVHIDPGAPVITRDSVLIHAPLYTIWKIQTDVENWPTWQPNVDVVVKDTPGRLRPGSVFR